MLRPSSREHRRGCPNTTGDRAFSEDYVWLELVPYHRNLHLALRCPRALLSRGPEPTTRTPWSIIFGFQLPPHRRLINRCHQKHHNQRESSPTLTRHRLRILIMEEHIWTVLFARQQRLQLDVGSRCRGHRGGGYQPGVSRCVRAHCLTSGSEDHRDRLTGEGGLGVKKKFFFFQVNTSGRNSLCRTEVCK